MYFQKQSKFLSIIKRLTFAKRNYKLKTINILSIAHFKNFIIFVLILNLKILNTKVLVEVSFYELHVRPANKGEKGLNYTGAGGLFEKHSTLFNSLSSFINFIRKKNFDDSILYHKDLENEFVNYYGDVFNGDELKYSADYFNWG